MKFLIEEERRMEKLIQRETTMRNIIYHNNTYIL